MKYYRINWKHNNNNEYPHIYYLEVDDEGYESKKMEIYEDGRLYYAYDEVEEGTFLSGEPIIDISLFNSNEDNEILKGDEIEKEEFYNFWNQILD
jgi:hypothetical protein